MKTIIVILICSFTVVTAYSQQMSKDSLLKKMSLEICVKMNEADSSLLKADDFELQLGLMMIPVMTDYKQELAAVIPGFVFEEQLESLSEQLGMSLAINCPKFLSLIAARPDLLNQTNLNPERTIEGKLVQIVEDEFTSIQIKLNNGRIEKLWWLEFFEGADALTSKTLVSKQVNIRYIEKEVYSAVLKDYILIKVITGINKK